MIRTENLAITIGEFQLRRISVSVERGQYLIILGPPGSGKSVFLQCLCGLRHISEGKIFMSDREVTHIEPRLRSIGYVPQDYALFPHLNVRENIAFGLRGRDGASGKVDRISRMLDIRYLLKRDVLNLSGGEKQRVALARAIVMEPEVLLLDEPVSSLDEATRQDVCELLRDVQMRLNLTVIHVSHNLEEAFSVADRAAIFRGGRVEQVGPISQLLRRPATEFTARFMRCENIFKGEIISHDSQQSISMVEMGGMKLAVPRECHGTVKFMIRPEDVVVESESDAQSNQPNSFVARLVAWRDFGSYVRLHLKCEFDIIANLPRSSLSGLDSEKYPSMQVKFPCSSIHVLYD